MSFDQQPDPNDPKLTTPQTIAIVFILALGILAIYAIVIGMAIA